jgi:hypothetical protein
MELKKQIAVYVFEALVKACKGSPYGNTDEAMWDMYITHEDREFYSKHHHEISEMTCTLKLAGFVEKVKRTGRYGRFTMLKPSKLGMERYNKLMQEVA